MLMHPYFLLKKKMDEQAWIAYIFNNSVHFLCLDIIQNLVKNKARTQF